MVAPAATYCSSLIPLPSPAVCWTKTRWPCDTSWRTPAGVIATRYSRVFISLGTPISMPAKITSTTQVAEEKLQVLEIDRLFDARVGDAFQELARPRRERAARDEH